MTKSERAFKLGYKNAKNGADCNENPFNSFETKQLFDFWNAGWHSFNDNKNN